MDYERAARHYAAQTSRHIAAECLLPGFGFASHVTQAEKEQYRDGMLETAEAIEAGKLDGNFTVRQLIHYWYTGESAPLLS